MPHTNPTNQSASSYVRNGLLYLLGGGIVGATAALLLAPKSGPELRSDISKAARKGYDETLDIAHRLKDRSDLVYRSIREKADDVYEFAAAKFSLSQNGITDTFETAEYESNGDANNDPYIRTKISGRRPSNIL